MSALKGLIYAEPGHIPCVRGVITQLVLQVVCPICQQTHEHSAPWQSGGALHLWQETCQGQTYLVRLRANLDGAS